MNAAPNSLKKWFLFHFIVDMIFGIPLILFPGFVLNLFGIASQELVTARIAGAALLGIGGASLFCRNMGKQAYSIMLTLKIIWSLAAILGILVSIGEGAPKSLWMAASVFIVFASVWIYYKSRL